MQQKLQGLTPKQAWQAQLAEQNKARLPRGMQNVVKAARIKAKQSTAQTLPTTAKKAEAIAPAQATPVNTTWQREITSANGVHLVAKAQFKAGRLVREAGEFLCKKGAHAETSATSEAVTCAKCIEMAERYGIEA